MALEVVKEEHDASTHLQDTKALVHDTPAGVLRRVAVAHTAVVRIAVGVCDGPLAVGLAWSTQLTHGPIATAEKERRRRRRRIGTDGRWIVGEKVAGIIGGTVAQPTYYRAMSVPASLRVTKAMRLRQQDQPNLVKVDVFISVLFGRRRSSAGKPVDREHWW